MRSDTSQISSASGFKITLLVSAYHRDVTTKLQEGAHAAFIDAGGNVDDCQCISVPGAWELPVVAKVLATRGGLDAIVALGCIISGETTHDRVIGAAIANGLMQVALEWHRPVSMGVLTCQTMEQALARAGGSHGNKGEDSMHAAIEAVTRLRECE